MQIKDEKDDAGIEVGKVQRKIEEPKFKKTQVITDEISELLIRQISRELYNHNLYNTFSNYFAMRGLDKLEDYYEARAGEEQNHHIWIREYLQDCNIPFAYPQVDAIEIEIPDEVSPFKQTVEAEIETTEWINEIYEKACEIGDQQTKKWLSLLINEQTEEESISLKIYQLACIDTDWITKQDAIIDFYERSQKEE